MPTQTELLQQLVELNEQQLQAILWTTYYSKATAFSVGIAAGFLASLLCVRAFLVRNLFT